MTTVDSTIASLAHRPALGRALASYWYALHFVAGGEGNHAGAIQALDAVHAAAPDGVDVSALAAAYVAKVDAERAVESARLARAARCTTLSWASGDSITVEGDEVASPNLARRVRITHEVVGRDGPITDEQRAEAIEARRAYLASVR